MQLYGRGKLLLKGISFCPSQVSAINWFQLEDNLYFFLGGLDLENSSLRKSMRTQMIIPSRLKSKWTPSLNRDPALGAYIRVVKKDVFKCLDEIPKNT